MPKSSRTKPGSSSSDVRASNYKKNHDGANAAPAVGAPPRQEEQQQPTQQQEVRELLQNAEQTPQQVQALNQQAQLGRSLDALAILAPRALAGHRARAAAACQEPPAANGAGELLQPLEQLLTQSLELEDALHAVKTAFDRLVKSYVEPVARQRAVYMMRRRDVWLPLLQLVGYSARRLLQMPVFMAGEAELGAEEGGGGSGSQTSGSSSGSSSHSGSGRTTAQLIRRLESGSVSEREHSLLRGAAAVLSAGLRPACVPPHLPRRGEEGVLGPLTHMAGLSARALLQGHTLRVYGRLAARLAERVARLLPPAPAPQGGTVKFPSAALAAGAEEGAPGGRSGSRGPEATSEASTAELGMYATACTHLQEVQVLALQFCASGLIPDIANLPREADGPDASAATAASHGSTGTSRPQPAGTCGEQVVAEGVPLPELLLRELAASGYLEHTARLAVNWARLEGARGSSSGGGGGGSTSNSTSSGGSDAGGSHMPQPSHQAGRVISRVLIAVIEGLCQHGSLVALKWVLRAHELSVGQPGAHFPRVPRLHVGTDVAASAVGAAAVTPTCSYADVSAGASGASRGESITPAPPPPPPLPWGPCLRYLALSQVVVTLKAAGFGGGVRGVWGLPQGLAAGLPLLGPTEGLFKTNTNVDMCDLRGKLRRHAEVQQLVRAHRQQQNQPAGRSKPVVFVLHPGPFNLLKQVVEAELRAAEFGSGCGSSLAAVAGSCSSSSSSSGGSMGIGNRALLEVLLGVARLAAGVPPTPDPMTSAAGQPQQLEPRPRLVLPQPDACDIGTAALLLARRLALQRPHRHSAPAAAGETGFSDSSSAGAGAGAGAGSDEGYPLMDPRWWRAVVALLPVWTSLHSDTAGSDSAVLTMREVLRMERLPGLLLPPRVPPALEVALAAGLVPTVETALRRAAGPEAAWKVVTVAFQMDTSSPGTSGSSWPLLQQLLAFAPPAQTAALITSLGKRAHAALDAAAARGSRAAGAQQAAGGPRLDDSRTELEAASHGIHVAFSCVTLLPPSPWACLTGGDGCGSNGARSGVGETDADRCAGSDALQSLYFVSPQPYAELLTSRVFEPVEQAEAAPAPLATTGWVRAAVVQRGRGGCSSSCAGSSAVHADQHPQHQTQLQLRTRQVRLLLSHALHRWLPVLSRLVLAMAHWALLDRSVKAPLTQLLLWVQPAFLALLDAEADAISLVAAAAAAAQPVLALPATESRTVAASWRQFLLRDVDVVAVMGVGLAVLQRSPPDDPVFARLSWCLLSALAAAALAIPDALLPLLQPPPSRPSAEPFSSGSGGGSKAGPSFWKAKDLRRLFMQRLCGAAADSASPPGGGALPAAGGGSGPGVVPCQQVAAALSWVEALREFRAIGSGSGTSGAADSFLGGVEGRRRLLTRLLVPGGGGAGPSSADQVMMMVVVPLSPVEAAAEGRALPADLAGCSSTAGVGGSSGGINSSSGGGSCGGRASVLPDSCANPRCTDLTGESELGGSGGAGGSAAAVAEGGEGVAGSSGGGGRARYSAFACTSCGAVRYCCRACQEEHWRVGHGEACDR